jgi:hypothetical protein
MNPLFEGMSHEQGRNAKVTLFDNRIERVQEKARLSLSRAKQDVEMTPLRSVTSVQTKKDGLRYTRVIVFASANTVEFRFSHADAEAFKNVLQQALLGSE